MSLARRLLRLALGLDRCASDGQPFRYWAWQGRIVARGASSPKRISVVTTVRGARVPIEELVALRDGRKGARSGGRHSGAGT